MSASEDLEILKRIRAGDKEAYSELVLRYQDRILQHCASMLSDAREGEDAAQEVFVKAFYALPRFKGGSAFYTWLYRIAHNHCLDRIRQRNRRPAYSWDHLIEEKGDEIEKLFADSGVRDRAGDRELVEMTLALLSEDYRAALVLREIQGLSYEEMTDVLGCSLAAVKSRLKRARRDFEEKLRHFLDKETV